MIKAQYTENALVEQQAMELQGWETFNAYGKGKNLKARQTKGFVSG